MIRFHVTDFPPFLPVQEALIDACKKLGHPVARWKNRRHLVGPCRYIVWWDCNIDQQVTELAKATGGRPIYLERGWTIDRDICAQLDWRGTGGRASWAEEALPNQPGDRLPVRDGGDLLVILRYELATGRPVDNVAHLSPFFKNNILWMDHLAQACRLPVRIRAHPEMKDSQKVAYRKRALNLGWAWDESPDFISATARAKAVAVIDSTSGVWAMELGLPVLCFGRQVYRHPGAVYCLDDQIEGTQAATQELLEGSCSLHKNTVQDMLNRIRGHQWYPKDAASFPDRLHKEFGL